MMKYEELASSFLIPVAGGRPMRSAAFVASYEPIL